MGLRSPKKRSFQIFLCCKQAFASQVMLATKASEKSFLQNGKHLPEQYSQSSSPDWPLCFSQPAPNHRFTPMLTSLFLSKNNTPYIRCYYAPGSFRGLCSFTQKSVNCEKVKDTVFELSPAASRFEDESLSLYSTPIFQPSRAVIIFSAGMR